jgi:short-subunit dehydrogenase involved in D-alanine esterification of teichoic acids
MLARSVLITGCNRGIGLELVKQWLKVDGPPEHIIATCRKPEEVKNIKKVNADVNLKGHWKNTHYTKALPA